MNRTAAAVYITWAMILIGIAVYAVRKMTDESDPSSLTSSLKQIEKSIDEDNQIP